MHVVHGSHDGLVMQSWDTGLVLQEQISFSERSLPKVFNFFFREPWNRKLSAESSAQCSLRTCEDRGGMQCCATSGKTLIHGVGLGLGIMTSACHNPTVLLRNQMCQTG